MNKILITGAAGFLGSNLAQYLLEDENNLVFGVDNFSSSTIQTLYKLLKNDRFNFIEFDLNSDITGLFDVAFDKIYHFSGFGDLKKYHKDAYEFMFNQINILNNIVKFAQTLGSRLITTTKNTDYQNHNYELFKYFDMLKFSEDLILDLIENNKLDAIILRLDSVYGKNMSKDDVRFVPKTIMNALNFSDIILNHDSVNYFTYVDDAIKNMVIAADNYCENKIVDIISPNLYLKSDVVNLIKKLTKSNSKLIIENPEILKPDYTPKTPQGLNLSYDFKPHEGIIETIKYFKLIYFNEL